MTTRTKKPKCTPANKTCGMVCKPKAAICADQRKKLITNSKKAGLRGQAAKDYVQSRIDRYKKLVASVSGAGGGRFAKVEIAYKEVMDIHKKISVKLDKANLELKKMDDIRNSPEYKKIETEKTANLGESLRKGISKKERDIAYAKYEAAVSKLSSLFYPGTYNKITDSITDTLLDPKVLKAHEELKSALMDSGLSQKEAQQQTEKIKMSAQVRKLRGEQVTEFVRLVGSVPPSLKKIEVTKVKRSFASDPEKSIGLNKEALKNTVYHEMGHHLEYGNPDLKAKAREWVVSRSTGDPQKLSTITGSNVYRDNEVAYPGNFVSPYVGKIYPDGNGEAVSVGIEHFSDPVWMANLYYRDPSHYKLIVDVIKGYQTRG